MKFEWDAAKERANRNKHGVSFIEATLIFADKFALSIYDETHSAKEDRWISIGITPRGLIVAVHTYKKGNAGEIVRIISARKATKREAGQYMERRT